MKLVSTESALQRFVQETEESGKDTIHINTIKRILQDMDADYDVDKVVGRLQRYIDRYDGMAKEFGKIGDEVDKEMSELVSIVYGNAVKVIKAGGESGKRTDKQE